MCDNFRARKIGESPGKLVCTSLRQSAPAPPRGRDMRLALPRGRMWQGRLGLAGALPSTRRAGDSPRQFHFRNTPKNFKKARRKFPMRFFRNEFSFHKTPWAKSSFLPPTLQPLTARPNPTSSVPSPKNPDRKFPIRFFRIEISFMV